MKAKPDVVVIGLGYIGLPTAALLARTGLSVLGVDIREDVVRTINEGRVPIDETGLAQAVEEAVKSGRLTCQTEAASADYAIIAVPTPTLPDKSPDLSFVVAAATALAGALQPGQTVIVESTIPPGTCIGPVRQAIFEASGLSDLEDYHLAHCPERVLPGNILQELTKNDRIVGGTTPAATEKAAALYRQFVAGDVAETDATTAELCKLMENTYRDVNIALANEFMAICEPLRVDVDAAIAMANRHPRVNIHLPGIGVGGHCIPVDPWFLVAAAPDATRLIATARQVNDARPEQVADRIIETVRRRGLQRAALLGLTYKPDVDDLRESPAVEIAKIVIAKLPIEWSLVEPHAEALPSGLAASDRVALRELDDALGRAQIAFTLVQHAPFKCLSTRAPIPVIDASRPWEVGP